MLLSDTILDMSWRFKSVPSSCNSLGLSLKSRVQVSNRSGKVSSWVPSQQNTDSSWLCNEINIKFTVDSLCLLVYFIVDSFIVLNVGK